MDSRTKAKNREEFLSLATRMGKLETSVLASAEPYPSPSPSAWTAARQMIGAVLAGRDDAPERLNRLASKLQLLKELDRASAPAAPRRRHG
jgi:hypothetical protein